jgi:hypothetical protein
MATMSLTRVSEYRFETSQGSRRAWVVTPTDHIRVGRKRLAELRKGVYTGEDLDREVLGHARQRAGTDQIVVICGKSADGKGSWRFADDLTEKEQIELGHHLVRDQLATYRRLVSSGVFALLHVDWGAAEVTAYADGTRQLLLELEESSIPEFSAEDSDRAAIDRVDRWILKHLTFFFTESIEAVIERVLSTQLPKLEERLPHLREMVKSLPVSAIR